MKHIKQRAHQRHPFKPGQILGLRSANERRRYKVTPSFIGWAQTQGKLNHKQLETHGCLPSTVATDTLVLKHQAISIHNTE